MRFALAIFISVTISAAAFSQEQELSNSKVDWDKTLNTYDVGNTNFYDFGLADDNQVSPPAYSDSNAAPPAYPFGNSVKMGNGVSCIRDGVAISCK